MQNVVISKTIGVTGNGGRVQQGLVLVGTFFIACKVPWDDVHIEVRAPSLEYFGHQMVASQYRPIQASDVRWTGCSSSGLEKERVAASR